jgi:sarcosine oxidase subunit beta
MFAMKRLWNRPTQKSAYDTVIIGGGLHGLAAAYYLARDHGLTDVAVIDRRYIGFGGAGRNTAIVRANQRTQENVHLYNEGLKLWPELTRELDFNLMFYNCGNLNLVHSEAGLGAFRMNVATAQFCGVKSELLDAKGCKEVVPQLDISDRLKFPIYGGMYHPPGGTIRHDALVWGLAKGAAKKGVHILQQTEVMDIGVDKGRVTSVRTDKGVINARRVLIAAGGYSTLLCRMVGILLPIHVLTIQAMVSQPMKPFLHHVVSSGTYHAYCHQSLKGELVTGSHMDPWPNYTTRVTARYIKHQAEALTEMMPCLKGLKFMRIWSGLADMTPDMAPIMDGNTQVENLFYDAGWGYFGFKSAPIAGRYMAKWIATGQRPDILSPFGLERYREARLQGETSTPINYGPWD